MKTQKILSLILVLLLLTSVSVPAVSAQSPAIIAIPATADMIVNGVTIAMAGIAALQIAENLGKTWDKTQKGWDQLMKDTGAALDNLFNAKKWIDATSSEADASLTFDYHTATSGSGGKKDDKLYHKAELKNGKVKINTERISENDAVRELKEGRDIFTATKELAENLVNRVCGENYEILKLKSEINPREPKVDDFEKLRDEEIELHHNGQKGYYKHYHPKYQTTRPHCWWKDL